VVSHYHNATTATKLIHILYWLFELYPSGKLAVICLYLGKVESILKAYGTEKVSISLNELQVRRFCLASRKDYQWVFLGSDDCRRIAFKAIT
jgi:hypothetical protein